MFLYKLNLQKKNPHCVYLTLSSNLFLLKTQSLLLDNKLIDVFFEQFYKLLSSRDYQGHEAIYEKLLISSNILMVVLIKHFFVKLSIWNLLFLIILVSIDLISLYWYHYDHAKLWNINHIIGMLNIFHAKYSHISMKIHMHIVF